jgi:hypothetical protein
MALARNNKTGDGWRHLHALPGGRCVPVARLQCRRSCLRMQCGGFDRHTCAPHATAHAECFMSFELGTSLTSQHVDLGHSAVPTGWGRSVRVPDVGDKTVNPGLLQLQPGSHGAGHRLVRAHNGL